MEVAVTLGMQAARQALHHAGESPEAIDRTLMVRGPASSVPIDVSVTSRIVALETDTGTVRPTRAAIVTDGLEAMFILEYEPVDGDRVTVQALYFEATEATLPGSVTVVDENRNVMSVLPLSRTHPATEIMLPAATGRDAPPVPGKLVPVSSPMAQSQAAEAPAPVVAARSWAWIVWIAAGLLAVLLLYGSIHLFLRLASPKTPIQP